MNRPFFVWTGSRTIRSDYTLWRKGKRTLGIGARDRILISYMLGPNQTFCRKGSFIDFALPFRNLGPAMGSIPFFPTFHFRRNDKARQRRRAALLENAMEEAEGPKVDLDRTYFKPQETIKGRSRISGEP